MTLGDLLRREHVVVPLEGTTLREAVDALIARLAETGAIDDAAAVTAAVRDRRGRDFVTVGSQVALPHARTDVVPAPIVAVGVAPRELTMDDAGPADCAPRIVVLILAPPAAATLYLRIVAALARLFRQKAIVKRFLDAAAPDDVLAVPELVEAPIHPRLAVRDLMVRVDAVPPDMPATRAVDLMIRRRLRALPVVGSKGEVLGVLSEWDVLRGLLPGLPRGESPAGSAATMPDRTVRDLMTRSVLCVSEDTPIEDAANTMLNKDLEQIPVVAEGALTGLLTRGDIIRKLFGR